MLDDPRQVRIRRRPFRRRVHRAAGSAVERQRACNADPALVRIGQRIRRGDAQSPRARDSERFPRGLVPGRRREWRVKAAASTFSRTRQTPKQTHGLKGARNATSRQCFRSRPLTISSLRNSSPWVGLLEAAHHIDKRGLAGAVGPSKPRISCCASSGSVERAQAVEPDADGLRFRA